LPPNFPPAARVLHYCRLAARGSIGSMYETFEHTADLGLRIRAPDLNTLFAEAAEALFATIVDDLGTVVASRKIEVEVTGDDREYLLFDWLKELLYRFDGEHLLFSRFSVQVTETGLAGTAWGEPLDRIRHALAHEVKAITYHRLKVEPTDDGWLAEVIVDI
jgi:SHS2 domain-containing protein